ncbi:MAG: hypothetical protein Q9190_004618, partial [Brigantiaea leucoxantha]
MYSPSNTTEKFTPSSQITHPEVVPAASDLEVDTAAYALEHRGDRAWHDEDAPEKYHQPNPSQARRILGLKPLIFWILILFITLILAVGVGVGLGVGLSSRSNNSKNADLSPATTTGSIEAIPMTSTFTSRTNIPTPTAAPHFSPPSANRDVSCPANNSLSYTPASDDPKSTAFTVNTTTLTYDIQCNTSYHGSDDIFDLQYIPNTNLSACIDLCSVYSTQVPFGGGDNGFYDLCSGVTVTTEEECQLKSGVEE